MTSVDSPVWRQTSYDRWAEGWAFEQDGGGEQAGSCWAEPSQCGQAVGPPASRMTSHSYLQRERQTCRVRWGFVDLWIYFWVAAKTSKLHVNLMSTIKRHDDSQRSLRRHWASEESLCLSFRTQRQTLNVSDMKVIDITRTHTHCAICELISISNLKQKTGNFSCFSLSFLLIIFQILHFLLGLFPYFRSVVHFSFFFLLLVLFLVYKRAAARVTALKDRRSYESS